MVLQTKWKFLFAMATVLSVALILAPQAKAVPYDVDPLASSVTFTAMIGASTLDLQAVGSDIEFFGGTIEATVPLGGGLLTLGDTAGFGDSFIPGLGNATAPFLPHRPSGLAFALRQSCFDQRIDDR